MGSSSHLPAVPGAGDDADPSLFLYLSDLTPASPSAYLDLPPTPHQEQPGGGSPSSSEDLVLPFISRMLMEEDIDDKFFYDYPDHPALLQAQQPFLDILSDPSSQSNSSDSNSNNNHLSPSDASVSTAAAVNSYDPARFTSIDLDPAALFGGGANSDLMSSAFLKGMEEANKFLPSEDKLIIDLEASSGEFLRGVEEAKKFCQNRSSEVSDL